MEYGWDINLKKCNKNLAQVVRLGSLLMDQHLYVGLAHLERRLCLRYDTMNRYFIYCI